MTLRSFPQAPSRHLVQPEQQALPGYAELFCVSSFSFLEGASQPSELVERAQALGYQALALTDECSLAGVVRAHQAAQALNFPLLIGSHFQFQAEHVAWQALQLIVIATDRIAYGHLSEFITLARNRADKGEYAIGLNDLAQPEAQYQHLSGLPGCLFILVPAYPLDPAICLQQAAWLAQRYPQRSWLGLCQYKQAADYFQLQHLQQISQHTSLPLVALGHVLMHKRSRKPLQDCLRAIRLGQAVSDCGYALTPNAEQHLRSRLRLANLFPAEALAATLEIASRCHFSLNELRYEYPDEIVPAGLTPTAYLRQVVYQGAQQRYPQGCPAKIQRQLEHELQLIAELQYEAYFLTVYDIVKFARSQSILCQGRGSAANSSVCYCLHITEVDPDKNQLLFERFISRERAEPPDIDVDFEHQRREEVIQYIYRKYGRNRTALAAAVHTYRPRGALREIGKALGVDPQLIDQLAKSQRWFDSKQELALRMQEIGLDSESRIAQLWLSLTLQLLNMPRHLSQHTGGFVIARDKLSRLVPIENAAMPERSVIQWDKDDLESLGLLKVDVLALGMLSALRRALQLMAALPGRPSRLQDIPREDSATYQMISRADTVGVFQIESRAQMSMLPRLKPHCFYDLVIQVAIVRPGPIQGGMVHPYLRRRQGLEAQESYPDAAMNQALGRTLGVPIFQEQVMQIAMIAADFSPGEADQLRRAMAAWKRKGGLEHYRQRIIQPMVAKGYDADFAAAIFEQMKGFGEYGFPESHAASFAILAYFSSWIKCHEPAVFLCALLNSQPMGFYSPSQLIQDARRHGVKVLPIDVQYSDYECSLSLDAAKAEHQAAVRLGLNQLSGLTQEGALRIVTARQQAAFCDVTDLSLRAALTQRDLQTLAQGNALHSLSGHRRQALWQALGAVASKDLLQTSRIPEQLPLLTPPSLAEEIRADYQAQGFSLQGHPLALLRPRLLAQRLLPASALAECLHMQFARGCGLVTVRQRPGTAKGVLFMTLEDESGQVNVIVWPKVFEQFRREALHARLLAVYGIWQSVNGVHHLIAKRLVDFSHMLGELATTSRDFC